MGFRQEEPAEKALWATSQNDIMAMEKRLKKGKTIHLLGIAFSSTRHSVQC